MKQNNTNKFKYSEFNTIYPSKPIKLVSSNDSIASMDTFASSAKSDDSLMEIWEKENYQTKSVNTIPIKAIKT